MNTTSAPLKHRHGLSSSTHHRLGYPLAGWFSPEPTSVSPSHFILHKVTSNTTRDALKNLGGLGAGPQVRWALGNGIRKTFSESVLTKSKTVADPGEAFSKGLRSSMLRQRNSFQPRNGKKTVDNAIHARYQNGRLAMAGQLLP